MTKNFFARKELNQTKVLVWAHSMGCAISQSMMAKVGLPYFYVIQVGVLGEPPPPHENLMTKVHLDDFEKIRLILETPFSNMRDQVKFLQEYGWITTSPPRFQRTQAVQEKPSWAALVSKTWTWSSSKFYIVLFC